MSKNKQDGLAANLSSLQADLAELCERETVNLARGPRERVGKIASLYLLPIRDAHGASGGLEVRIVPLAPLADVEDEILQGVRDSARELLRDENISVRERAESSLKRMALPRLSPEQLRGHLFSLTSPTRRGGKTSQASDRNGKVRFENLPQGETEFLLEYGGCDSGAAEKTRHQ